MTPLPTAPQPAQKDEMTAAEIQPAAAAGQYDADYVVLKSGRTIKCKVLESNDEGVQIEMTDGTIFYYRAVDVERVERRPDKKAVEAARDVIVLKNGQKVQGTVLERSINAPIKLRNVYGQVFTYKWDEVERILIDQNKKAAAPAEKAQTHKFRLAGTAEVGIGYGLEQNRQLVGEMNPEFSLTVGTRISRLFYVGVGATVQRYDRTEIMPVTRCCSPVSTIRSHGKVHPLPRSARRLFGQHRFEQEELPRNGPLCRCATWCALR